MNPGPTLGAIAVLAAYTVVLGAVLIYLKVAASKKRRLEERRRELEKLRAQ